MSLPSVSVDVNESDNSTSSCSVAGSSTSFLLRLWVDVRRCIGYIKVSVCVTMSLPSVFASQFQRWSAAFLKHLFGCVSQLSTSVSVGVRRGMLSSIQPGRSRRVVPAVLKTFNNHSIVECPVRCSLPCEKV